MKKYEKKIMLPILILFFSLGSIFCCCLTSSSQVGRFLKVERSATSQNHCCPRKTTHKDDYDNGEECQCEKVATIFSSKEFKLTNIRNDNCRFLERNFSFFEKAEKFNQRVTKKHVLQLSFQFFRSDPLIYLQDCILRI